MPKLAIGSLKQITPSPVAEPYKPNTVVHRTDTPPKTLRGLNKPKCKQCGNVARSRLRAKAYKASRNGILLVVPHPFCYLFVAVMAFRVYMGQRFLKANATFPDKTPPSNSTLFDQHSTEASPSGNSHRVASLRQLSNTFAQFNNVQIPLRSRKPMTRKDAAAINEWRFSKLKEYKDRNIEVEDEAFDRYMQNVNLLEELFSVKSIPERSMEDVNSIPERSMEDGTSNHDPTSMDDETGPTVSGLKLMLRSDPVRTDNFRERMKQIVDQGLNKLQKCELDYALNEPINQNELDKGPKRTKDLWAERASALSDLNDRLNKARNDEDLKYCLELKSQLFSHHTSSSHVGSNSEILKDQNANNNLESTKVSNYSLSRLVTSVEIDQETLRNVDAHFSSLQQIEGL
ncbi:hypothetical protein FEM48_Zijuj11G0077300 [Ziziphus jujuba var. spinosa]|uniref:Uncharacterized protein n=1 Tax=Ziziphus jujuba var. spinosa TaxID=714518 RepID=A0A978UHP8_ZIZJJ|nr:hypothetical protein FEM48_Zijuj11G0077300 [Ziziphus jujuba var. spinosa]